MFSSRRISPLNYTDESARSNRALGLVLWAVVALVLASFVCEYSIRLAGVRIYGQDECRSVCAAYVLGAGKGAASGATVSLFFLPLIWLAHGATHAVDLYASGRFFSVELFWLNLVLLTAATGGKLFSPRSVVVLAGAATLAPLWDFGFEIRPDNLVLTGLLLMWCVLRVRPRGLQSYFIAGLLAAGLQFVAIKSLAYTVPISLAAIIFSANRNRIKAWKLALAWSMGVAAALLCIRFGYGAAGLWDAYLRNWSRPSGAIDETTVAWWPFVERMLVQVPLLLGLVTAGLTALAMDVRSRGKAAISSEGMLPEGALFVLALLVFLLNGKASPPELLYLTAFGFLLAARYVAGIAKEITVERAALISAIVLFGHLIPFFTLVERHANFTSYHQEGLMSLAEQMTEPGKDAVYDRFGMVPTRRPADYELFFHQWNGVQIRGDLKPALSELLTSQPPSVIVADARFDQLSETDQKFVSERYVPVSPDFWVLGTMLPAGGGDFEISHRGRYKITSAEASNLFGTYRQPQGLMQSPPEKFPPLAGTLDGLPLNDQPVLLAPGVHHLKCASEARAAVAWLGPELNSVPRITGGSRETLFAGWF